SQFASRYKKDLSTEALRTKVARRKSVLQKENRHKLFEKGRQFGLADVNVQLPKERGISGLNEKSEASSQENSSVKQKQPPSAATKRLNERREMLQRYKEEKELRKLKEQREKAKKGVFKVGLYKPTVPAFLSFIPEDPVIVKPREKAAPAFSGRITRSKARSQEEKNVIPATSKHSMVCFFISFPVNKFRGKALKPLELPCPPVLQAAVQTTSNVRITRAASSAARQVLKTSTAAATAAFLTVGNQPQRKNVGKQKKAVKPDIPEVAAFEFTPTQVPRQFCVCAHALTVLCQISAFPPLLFAIPSCPVSPSHLPSSLLLIPLGTVGLTELLTLPLFTLLFFFVCVSWEFQGGFIGLVTSVSGLLCPLVNHRIGWVGRDLRDHQVQPLIHSRCSSQPMALSATSRLFGKISRHGESTTSLGSPFQCLITLSVKCLHAKAQENKVSQGGGNAAEPVCHEQARGCIMRLFSSFKEQTSLHGVFLHNGDLLLVWVKVIMQLMCSFAFLTCNPCQSCLKDVNKKFDNLKKLQDNDWQPLDVPSKAIVKKKTLPNGVSKPKLGAAGRAAARNRLAAVKAAMRDKLKHDEGADGTQQEKPAEVEKVVFEAGFFRIESPVK
ncbi:Disks large-associated protein 5, partial [Calypte anna]